ncbi:dGTP triphosphohydrolase [Patulibacter sp. SYSU D01012]|uniref:deoxyguanosinetriphosphate triphosphohydrolase family protein n=1 Tax=Patulibacter sp. SYSU D01012 TaxID=2817381 RepID=UPI001B31710D|nr:dNTP triphosphohydrolase [Patulibacter sp. SYSU D01012]
MRVPVRVPTDEEKLRLDDRIPATLARGEGATAGGRPVPNDAPRSRYRTGGQRDRDRILYASAFQRLGGVTQVTEPELGHAFHTRLTHSLKVAQLARRSTEKLLLGVDQAHIVGNAARLVSSLDPDASEAAGLAHDLGHPPFGHVAEEALERLNPSGGFEGNAQSFRILTRLAIREPAPGLALTRRTLNGALKYPWARRPHVEAQNKKWGTYVEDVEAFDWARRDSALDQPSLTARLMDWADDITYAVHDVDDFFRAGLVPLDRLAAGNRSEIARLREGLEERGKDDIDGLIGALQDALSGFLIDEAYDGGVDQRAALRDFASSLITSYLNAISVEDDPTDPNCAWLRIEEDAERQVAVLKELTWVYVIQRPSLAVLQSGRRQVINRLYETYFEATEPGGDARLLPPAYRPRLKSAQTPAARHRLVTDLVAGLTEASALALYRRISGVDPGTVLDAAARGA